MKKDKPLSTELNSSRRDAMKKIGLFTLTFAAPSIVNLNSASATGGSSSGSQTKKMSPVSPVSPSPSSEPGPAGESGGGFDAENDDTM